MYMTAPCLSHRWLMPSEWFVAAYSQSLMLRTFALWENGGQSRGGSQGGSKEWHCLRWVLQVVGRGGGEMVSSWCTTMRARSDRRRFVKEGAQPSTAGCTKKEGADDWRTSTTRPSGCCSALVGRLKTGSRPTSAWNHPAKDPHQRSSSLSPAWNRTPPWFDVASSSRSKPSVPWALCPALLRRGEEILLCLAPPTAVQAWSLPPAVSLHSNYFQSVLCLPKTVPSF
jgi:hypothetical protein